jgi:hypothetical protein
MSDKRKKAAKAARGYKKGKELRDSLTPNKPVRTPGHPTKSHVVLAKEGDKEKIIRFGQQGVKGAGKNPTSEKDKARKKSYYARHNAQDSNPSKMSARYWSHRVKWMILSGMIIGDAILQCLPNVGTMLT